MNKKLLRAFIYIFRMARYFEQRYFRARNKLTVYLRQKLPNIEKEYVRSHSGQIKDVCRIDDSPRFDKMRDVHEIRYRVASGFTADNTIVLDAGCGSGHGKRFLKGRYIGVDINPPSFGIQGDLLTWKPEFDYDVFVGFEIIEHLKDYTNFVSIAKRARKWVIVSTPIVPTTHYNPFHIHDFTMEDIQNLFIDEEWGFYGILIQRTGGKTGIFIFHKNNLSDL